MTMPDVIEKNPAIWRSGVILAIMAAACTSLVAITHSTTAPRIAANAQAFLEASLQPVLAGIEYDGKLSESTLVIPAPHELPGRDAATVYRVFADNKPVAALFVVTARDGFAGPIRLLIGVSASGNITGVSVLEHRETPGLGDLIEASKSDWLQQFRRASINFPDRSQWSIKRDGGVFDQLTGASITPRAVIRAIRETLLYFEANSEQVFAQAAPAEDRAPQ
jgi:electron transport complex protein RnfG